MTPEQRKKLQAMGLTDEQIAQIEKETAPVSLETLPEDLKKKMTEREEAIRREVETKTESIVSAQFRGQIEKLTRQMTEFQESHTAVQEQIRLAKEAEEKAIKDAEEKARASMTAKERQELMEKEFKAQVESIRQESASEIANLKEGIRKKEMEHARIEAIREAGLEAFSRLIPDTTVNPALTMEALSVFIEEAKKVKDELAAKKDDGGAGADAGTKPGLGAPVPAKSRPVVEPTDQSNLGSRSREISRTDLEKMSAREINDMIRSGAVPDKIPG